MVSILLYTIALLITFFLLHIITEFYFVESLETMSQRFRIPSDIAGSTLMAIGSSAPELAVALIAVLIAGEHEAIGIGTIVGSALFNILFIVGYVMMMRKSVHIVKEPIIRIIIT